MKLKNLKSVGASVLAVALTLSLAACANDAATGDEVDANSAVVEDTADDAQESGAAALGFGVVSTAGDGAGSATANTTVAAVLVDENGVIVDVKIDVAQNKVFSEGGVVAGEEEYRSKQEKEYDYGMAGSSAIEKEWFEQIAFFTEYLIGMNVADVAAIEIDAETSKAVEEDLLAGCTIKMTDYLAAVALAIENATEFNCTTEDTLALAVNTTASVKDATAEADGSAQTDSTFVALVTGTDGVVNDIYFDVTQCKFTVAADDTITGAGEVLSKQQLLYDYGMVGASAIEKEWFEQIAVFSDYVVGMNAADIAAVEIDEETSKSVDEDLLAGCTIKITSYVAVAVKAVG